MTTQSADTPQSLRFDQLGLPENLLKALRDVGYEQPSPIQAQTIPILLTGRDLIGQAQTGTGKTAAFALPILARIDPSVREVQALVLAPTRELAIQVAEAFQKYASHLGDFHVAPIYGGAGYGPQLHALKRGAQVVVGTPGRVIDHLEKGTLKLSSLRCLVLDEADEMLRMGFIDDVETVLKKTPETRQVALFSATMPPPIKKIAQKYLKDAEHIAIASVTRTAERIRARVLSVPPAHKLEAFTRLLEVENFDGMIVFVRTKSASEELADKLAARGFAAAAINGDLAQNQRERVIEKLKNGSLDILVATDVAARGLDVERITHVVNYDLPTDAESYVHRIGRTGRAGRSGDAILFCAPRERGWLKVIERSTKQVIEPMQLPSIEAVNDRRVAKLIERIAKRVADGKLERWQDLVERLGSEMLVEKDVLAAAVVALLKGEEWLLKLDHDPLHSHFARERGRDDAPAREGKRERTRETFGKPARESRFPRESFDAEPPSRGKPERRIETIESETRPRKPRLAAEPGMKTYRVEVGHLDRVKPGNLVGAIANELGLTSKEIGRIEIESDFTMLDLPDDLTREAIIHLKKIRVAGKPLNAVAADEASASAPRKPRGDRYDAGDKPRSKSFEAGGKSYEPRAKTAAADERYSFKKKLAKPERGTNPWDSKPKRASGEREGFERGPGKPTKGKPKPRSW